MIPLESLRESVKHCMFMRLYQQYILMILMTPNSSNHSLNPWHKAEIIFILISVPLIVHRPRQQNHKTCRWLRVPRSILIPIGEHLNKIPNPFCVLQRQPIIEQSFERAFVSQQIGVCEKARKFDLQTVGSREPINSWLQSLLEVPMWGIQAAHEG